MMQVQVGVIQTCLFVIYGDKSDQNKVRNMHSLKNCHQLERLQSKHVRLQVIQWNSFIVTQKQSE